MHMNLNFVTNEVKYPLLWILLTILLTISTCKQPLSLLVKPAWLGTGRVVSCLLERNMVADCLAELGFILYVVFPLFPSAVLLLILF